MFSTKRHKCTRSLLFVCLPATLTFVFTEIVIYYIINWETMCSLGTALPFPQISSFTTWHFFKQAPSFTLISLRSAFLFVSQPFFPSCHASCSEKVVTLITKNLEFCFIKAWHTSTGSHCTDWGQLHRKEQKADRRGKEEKEARRKKLLQELKPDSAGGVI